MDKNAPTSGRLPRVLLVDDDPVGRKLSVLNLRHAGFEVETASTAEEALRIAPRVLPDAIVSDIRMPGMDGFQLCQALKSDAQLKTIPILLLSAVVVETHEQERATTLGVRCFLRTPGLHEVVEALAEALRESDH